MKKLPLSYIKLAKANLIHNFKQFKKFAKAGTRFSVAIKGNAYGHGQNIVAKILEPHVDYFQVDDTEELELLRKVSKKKVLMLGYVGKNDLKKVIKLGCTLAIFSLEQMLTISAIAKSVNTVQEVQIPLDAYLGREGFLLKDLPKLLTEIQKYHFLKLTGIYAHFANIEDTMNFTHAKKQIDEYQKALKVAEEFGFKDLQTHISATSGFLAYEKNKGINKLVRLGIGVYGMWPSENMKLLNKNKINLKPALSWKSSVAQVKILPKGRTIGYGLTYKTKKRTKVAIIPQGYSDGFDRGFSNNGLVLIRGNKCKVLGRVSMNMLVVDVNHIKNVREEDEVVILGSQHKEEIRAEDMAKRIGTINYEITTRISPLLPRVVV